MDITKPDLQKVNSTISIITLLAIFIWSVWYVYSEDPFLWFGATPGDKACAQDAMICPDGSAVGRTGPNCEFTKCPTSHVGQQSISDWKIYRNEKYGFEVRYPKDWMIVPTNPLSDNQIFFSPKNLVRPLISIRVISRIEFEKTKEFMFADEQIIEEKQLWVAGVRAKRVVSESFKSLPEISVFFEKGNHSFSFGAIQGGEDERVIEIFDQILSTFKFLP